MIGIGGVGHIAIQLARELGSARLLAIDTQADRLALAMLARGGTYAVIGYGGTVSAPSSALVGQEHAIIANLVGSWTDLWELIQMHATGRLTLRVHTHPLQAVNEVLDRLRAGAIVGRAVLVP